MPTRLRTLVLITGWFMSSLALIWWSRAIGTPLDIPPAVVFDQQALARTATPPLGLPPVPVPDE